MLFTIIYCVYTYLTFSSRSQPTQCIYNVYLLYYILHIRTSINSRYIIAQEYIIAICYLAYNFFVLYINRILSACAYNVPVYKTSYSIVLRACNRAFVIISARDVSLDKLQSSSRIRYNIILYVCDCVSIIEIVFKPTTQSCL